jgi:alpha-tubulin suppressor-like RCC1 family protein
VVAPHSKDKVVKTPLRLSWFKDAVLRDLQLSKNCGGIVSRHSLLSPTQNLTVAVAVNDKGDILQWGDGYVQDLQGPETTLRGKNIQKVVLSKDKIIALSKNKTIYTLPISKKLQKEGPKQLEPSWIPWMNAKSDISYRILKPELGCLESVKEIAAGQEHLLVLTSAGRLFSAAVSFQYPAKGQMGISNLTYSTRPTGKPYDTLQEITSLKDYKITQIAVGDYHSVTLDNNGQLFTFGDNTNGQLGFEFDPEFSTIDVPTIRPIKGFYPEKNLRPTITKIAAGGVNTYLMIDVEDTEKNKISADVLSCGTGIYGNLANGRWTHIQGTPTKIKSLSNLFEYDEATNKLKSIRLQDICVGATHTAATLDTSTPSKPSTDVTYGNDALFWGNNEFYQLGTGKRNNSNVPVHIQPLGVPADVLDAKFTGSSNRGGNDDRISGIIGGQENEESERGATEKDLVHRFQISPVGQVKGGGKAKQVIVCGRGNTAVYMKRV